MRQRGKRGAAILGAAVIQFALPSFAGVFAAEPLQETVTPAPGADTALSRSRPEGMAQRKRVPAASGLHFEIGGRYAQYLHMDEPYQYSPMAALVTPTYTGWDRQWREESLWLRARYDIPVGGSLVLQPGLLLGAAHGWFAARNDGLDFFEEWRTRPALLAGLSLAGELRADPARGPFLTARFQFSRAEAGEAHETVSDGPTITDDRDARFRWQESEAVLGVGCRWGSFMPVAGIAYTDFLLKKWLNFDIPEEGLRGFEQQVVSALNNEESEYHFENKNPWTPFLELYWQLTPVWSLVARGTFAGSNGYSASLRLGY